MKVYVVWQNTNWEDSCLVGIFSSQHAADVVRAKKTEEKNTLVFPFK